MEKLCKGEKEFTVHKGFTATKGYCKTTQEAYRGNKATDENLNFDVRVEMVKQHTVTFCFAIKKLFAITFSSFQFEDVSHLFQPRSQSPLLLIPPSRRVGQEPGNKVVPVSRRDPLVRLS